MGQQSKVLEARIKELEGICADAYIAVGALADRAGVLETEPVLKLMDNLCYAKANHKDVIPFELPDIDLRQDNSPPPKQFVKAEQDDDATPPAGALEGTGELKNVQQEGTGTGT